MSAHGRGRLQDRYDWVVVGDHPAALVAGLAALKRGNSVLFVPFGDRPGREPQRQWVLGGLEGGSFGRLVRENLGISPADLGIVPARAEILHPRFRFRVPDRLEAWWPRIRRDLLDGEDASRATRRAETSRLRDWSTGLAAAVESGRLDRREASASSSGSGGRKDGARRESWRRPWEAPLQELLADTQPAEDGEFLSALRAAASPESAPGRWRARPAWETWWAAQELMMSGKVEGGWSALQHRLRELGREWGGSFLGARDEVSRFFVESGRVVGLQILARTEMIQTHRVLVGAPVRRIHDRFSGGEAPAPAARLAKAGTGLPASPLTRTRGFTLSVIVREEAVSEQVPDYVIWTEEGVGGVPLEIEVIRPRPGPVRIVARATLGPDELRAAAPDPQLLLEPSPLTRVIRARMLRKLTEVFPYIEFHAVEIQPNLGAPTSAATEAGRGASADRVPSPEEPRAVWLEQGEGWRSPLSNLAVLAGERFALGAGLPIWHGASDLLRDPQFNAASH